MVDFLIFSGCSCGLLFAFEAGSVIELKRGESVNTEGRVLGEECIFDVLLAVEAEEEGR
jgi:hypothetical protein